MITANNLNTKEQKFVKLDEFLIKKQIKEIDDYIKSQRKAGKKAIDCTQGLKDLLKKNRDDLIRKGIDSNYLAYVIAWEYTRRGL